MELMPSRTCARTLLNPKVSHMPSWRGAFFPILIRVDQGQEDGMAYFNPPQRSPMG